MNNNQNWTTGKKERQSEYEGLPGSGRRPISDTHRREDVERLAQFTPEAIEERIQAVLRKATA